MDSKWIPVGERLPELGEFVLACGEDWTFPAAVLQHTKFPEQWTDAEGYLAEPTHWMPLPPNPGDA